jgi:hypothetical protein
MAQKLSLPEFKSTLSQDTPPAGLDPLLQALWFDAKGDWESAHNIAQDIHSSHGSWMHAYLHRKEGDHGNASYWYHRANQPVSRKSLQEEWEQLAAAFLV